MAECFLKGCQNGRNATVVDAGLSSVLTEINIEDMLNAWGLGQAHLGRGVWRAIAQPAARDFAREMIRFDAVVGSDGLRRGGETLCRRYTGGVRVAGLEHVPIRGPLLLLANHPGLCDTVALFAVIPRDDLRVIALDRPFLRALPHTARRLYLLPDEVSERVGITRAVARFIRDGGAALTFPAGHIEPDPLVLPGAVKSLGEWSKSIGIFVRLVPDVSIVVAMVGGVYELAALRNPLTRLRRQPKDRELLAAALQLAWRPYQRNVVHVAFAPPLHAADLLSQYADPARIAQAITDAARGLLDDWPTEWQTEVRKRGSPLPR
jgi:hypothetical protein